MKAGKKKKKFVLSLKAKEEIYSFACGVPVVLKPFVKETRLFPLNCLTILIVECKCDFSPLDFPDH